MPRTKASPSTPSETAWRIDRRSAPRCERRNPKPPWPLTPPDPKEEGPGPRPARGAVSPQSPPRRDWGKSSPVGRPLFGSGSMSRIFLSHSSRNSPEAIALKRWLVEQEPGLAEEIFLDLDRDAGIAPG